MVDLVVGATRIGEVGGHCDQVEVGLEVVSEGALVTLGLMGNFCSSVKWVHNTLVWESSLYQLEMLVSSEREMIDFVREVELMSLHHECHNDIVECM